MRKANRFLSIFIVISLLISMIPNVAIKASAATQVQAEPYPFVEYGYTEDTKPGTIRYINQHASNVGYFDSRYWPDTTFGGYSTPDIECGTSSISMALSYIDINKTPNNILGDGHNGYTNFGEYWGGSTAMPLHYNELSAAMDRYINGNGKYSPPIIHLDHYSYLGHYVVLVGRISSSSYYVLDPSATSIWTITINGSNATYAHPSGGYTVNDTIDLKKWTDSGWSENRDDDIYQYYNPNAVICDHKNIDNLGACENSDCNYVYDWESTYETGSAGIYKVTKLTGIWLRTNVPYEASEDKISTKITYGKEVEVLGSVTNAVGTEHHLWYKVSYKGEIGYTSADNLKFKSLGAQNIYVEENSFVPNNNATILKAAQNLEGKIISTYPLSKIVAYLDGKKLTTWDATDKETYVFELKRSVIDYALPFDSLAPGKHTIELEGVDIHRTTLTTFHTSYFYTETSTPEPIYYTVIYNPNGGNCGTNSVSVKENTEIGALPTPTREGYEFNGWYTAAVGGNQITANTVFTSNKTIYAQWSPVYYTVSYDTQSDSGITYDSIEVQHGYTLGELPAPTKRGYDFLGWYTAAVGGSKVTTQTKVTAAMTLYAHWNPVTVVVTFDANGGTVGVTQKTVTYDQTYGELPTPMRSGHTFVRWKREAFGTVTSDTVLEWYLDHTLVAQWEKTVYEVPGGKVYFDTTTGLITGADAKITSAEIPDTIGGAMVVGVADEAFSMCTVLTDVVLPNSVKTIGTKAFSGCCKLEYITLGASVTQIGDDAFRYCYDLTAIELPESLTHIGNSAFYNCSALVTISVPSKVVAIGEQAFDNCFALTAVNVDGSNGIYASDNGVLMSKDKATLIYCPAKIDAADGSYAVPEGTKTIVAYAFDDCGGLDSIHIPKSVTSIDVTAFSASLINVAEENETFSSLDGVLFNKDKTVLLRFPEIQQRRYDIPEGVVEIGDYAFSDCNLSSIYMPEGLTVIGKKTFEYAFDLYDVNLPSTLQRIEDQAFSCYGLKQITIPENVTYIGNAAFSSCSQLTAVYFLGAMPTLGEKAFSASTACLYYKDWMGEWTSPTCNGYKTAVWESRLAVEGGYIYYDVIEGYITDCDNAVSDILIPATINGTEIVGIDSDAFSKCTEAKSITIPQGLTRISMRAFTGGSIEAVVYQGTVEQWLGHRVTTSYVLDGVSIQCTDKTIPANLTHVGLCSNGILWYLSTEGVLTIDGVGAIEDYASGTAPWYIFLAPVMEIIISEGITRIGTYSFYNLDAKKVTIPSSCTSIGDKAFKGCSLLQTVVIPDGVKEIGQEAFCDCKALSEITIPTSVDTLGYRAFNNSAQLTTVYYAGSNSEWDTMVKGRAPSYFDEGIQIYCNGKKLPENTIYMGTAGEDIEWFLSVDGTLTITGTGPMVSDYEIRVDYAPGDWYYDYGCSWEYYESRIVNVVIEDGITSISPNAFLQHEMLESVSIPSSVTKIEEAAFANCSNLKSITIPGSVSSMGYNVFANCTSLTTAIFEDGSLTELPYYAFWHCESLQNVDLPDSLVNLGYLSFVGCKSLKTLHISENVETCTLMSIGSDTGIEAFSVDPSNKHLSSVDGVLFDKSVSTLHLYPQVKTAESYYLPETVTTISEEAFFGNTYLKTVTIPANIYEIGDRAFFECTNLKGVYFIGQSPYYEGEDVFKKYVEGSNSNFENLPNVAIYYLEDEYCNGGWYGSSYDEYKMETWKFEVVEYQVTDGKIYFETITGRIVEADTSVTAVTIPAQINGWYVTSIGESAFENCTSLTSITLPNTVTRIESDAFFCCYSLTSIDLPDSVSYIGSDAFSGCASLTSIVIPEGVTEVPTWAFDYCRKLASITIPRSVKTIQYAAFEECESLNHILYRGTAEEWAKIDIVAEDNEYLLNARAFHCEVSGAELYAKKSCTYSGMCCSVCEEFVYGSLLDSDEHNFQDYVCTKCDAPQVLRYTLKENGEAVVEGIGVLWYGIEIEIPSHIEGCRVVEIADNAFVNSPMKSIVIPNTVETIGYSAFLYCTSLENVVIGSGLKTMNMPGTVFDSCDKLQGIWVDPDNQYFSSDEYGVLFNKDHSVLIKYPDAGPAIYTVPDEVITIGQSAFVESANLEVIYIGSGVTVIELSAFSSCKKLKEVHLNEALSSIENYAFYQCNSLSDVYYGGTTDRWDDISIGAENSSLLSAKLHTTEPVIMVNNNGIILEFTSIADAIDQVSAGAVLQLIGDVEENVVVSKNIVLDLNGFDITGSVAVTPNASVTVKDSQTDDYTIKDGRGYGKITGQLEGVKAQSGYLMIAEENGVSFHRVDLDIYAMTLRPSEVGVYYKSNFAGDEVVSKNVVRYGIALSVAGVPTEDNLGCYSWFENFQTGKNSANGTLLYGVMKTRNSAKQNEANANMPIYGRAYILTQDGRYVFGDCVNRSLREQVELADDQWNGLTIDQQLAILNMYKSYKTIMEKWNIPNIVFAAK